MPATGRGKYDPVSVAVTGGAVGLSPVEERQWPQLLPDVVARGQLVLCQGNVQGGDVVLDVLSPGGAFATYTYVQSPLMPAGKRFREKLQRCFGNIQISPVIWQNLPPAIVYGGRKRS